MNIERALNNYFDVVDERCRKAGLYMAKKTSYVVCTRCKIHVGGLIPHMGQRLCGWCSADLGAIDPRTGQPRVQSSELDDYYRKKLERRAKRLGKPRE